MHLTKKQIKFISYAISFLRANIDEEKLYMDDDDLSLMTEIDIDELETIIRNETSHCKTEQIDGDKNWWEFGGTFLVKTEQNDTVNTDIWHVIGLDEEYGGIDPDPDKPGLTTKVYRCGANDHDNPDWAYKDARSIASTAGKSEQQFKQQPVWLQIIDVASYFGWINFDQYPDQMTREAICAALHIE